MTARLSLAPKLATTSAPEMDLSRLPGQLERFLIHICHHQNFVGFIVLNHDWKQAVGIEPDLQFSHQ
jgi:hypothetical protein